MIRPFTPALCLAAVLTTGACATVTRGNSEDVQFTSAPSGATVTTSQGLTCVTPCTLDIKRNEAFYAAFRHKGQTRQIKVMPKTSGQGVAAGAGNILVGGLVGVAVDAGTGANLDHVPNPVHADFSKPQAAAQQIAEAHAKAVARARAEAKAKERAEDDS
ncbi:translation initiation factor 2 [Roseovarius sp. SCSIO 43702]|uniref:translation initiation factor 2 n=1 Tax=Roseovarius sp. SCSIO 43702 TaxID=2823043 RepID=UPI001C72BC78|nr:translation initiation factor 2 [Roseovarius sp. SCSIO 43702]QYX55805.1 translation initiation factor 2 [Roseovarius sp. SCSIO 43702]